MTVCGERMRRSGSWIDLGRASRCGRAARAAVLALLVAVMSISGTGLLLAQGAVDDSSADSVVVVDVPASDDLEIRRGEARALDSLTPRIDLRSDGSRRALVRFSTDDIEALASGLGPEQGSAGEGSPTVQLRLFVELDRMAMGDAVIASAASTDGSGVVRVGVFPLTRPWHPWAATWDCALDALPLDDGLLGPD